MSDDIVEHAPQRGMFHTKHWIYDLSTGLFTGVSFEVPDDHVQLQIPEGHGAISGVSDHYLQMVDLTTTTVVTNPAGVRPLTKAERALKDTRRLTLGAIADLEATQHRVVREAVLSGDSSALRDLDNKIASLRKSL